ncbi:GIY-YIG nuclease family protein [Deminuibacter soli]|uniref:GIY-YIG nuclease family protein n=1 Tax=Deminuibacter soli TaxID=2291815 RepID=A0A3E1NM35_9BACT|nr:GIY-YIG nuclease family protein [Deminuibacter soli]RFM28884.1 GIY-YIG nuclease family protein [Deminuibacter soli]
MFIVYVLYSERFDKIYIGYTSNLPERLRSHNELGKKGWTIRYRPWLLIHTETFETKQEALSREKELKNAKWRAWIRDALIPR